MRRLVVLSTVVLAASVTVPDGAAARTIGPAEALPAPAALPGLKVTAMRPVDARAWVRLTGVRRSAQRVLRDHTHALIVRVASGPGAAAKVRSRARREASLDRRVLRVRRVPSPVLVPLAGGAVAELVVATQPRSALRRALMRLLRGRAARAAALTPWTQLLARVERRGLTVRDALRAFAMSVAPLPGQTVPKPGMATDGTLAVRWVSSIFRKLPRVQQAAIVKALTAPVPASAQAAFQYDLSYEQMAQTAAKVEGAQLGFDLTIPIVAGTGDPDGIANAVTTPIDLQGAPIVLAGNGNPNHPLFACRIALTPKGQAQFGARLEETMYHEVFHCFQVQMAGLKRWLEQGKQWDWLTEGSAEWVGCALAPAAGDANGWYAAYLTDPGTAVFDRDYADMGFYAHLDEEGVDTWGHWPTAFQQDTMQDALDIMIGANEQQVFETWAPGFAREANRGPLWDAKAPCIPPERAPIGFVAAYKGLGPKAIDIEAYANRLDELSSDTGALSVAVEKGFGRLSSADGAVDESVGDDELCVRAGGCKCPDGLGNETTFRQASSPVLALGGGRKGGRAVVQAIDVDQFCQHQPGPGGGGGAGGGYSNGDPHMQTFDGRRYDFMAAGEFELARSADGSIDVQGRQEPFGGELDVTVNTAIALRAGSHRVGVYVGTQRAPAPVVRLDGRVVDPIAAPIDLGGGNHLRGGSEGYTVDLANGTRITIRNASIWGLVVVIDPPPAFKGSLQGLLGNLNGSQDDDLRVAGDGARIDPKVSAQLYGAFRRSWLVGRRTLFDYAPGRTTRSYDKPAIPQAPVSFGGLQTPRRRAARKACAAAGVHAEPFLSQCLLDVAVTGKTDFAGSTAALQQTLTDNAHRANATAWQNLGSDPPDGFGAVPVVGATGANRVVVAWPVRTSVSPEQHELTSVQFTSSAAGAMQPPLVMSSVVSGWAGMGSSPSLWRPAPGQVAVLFSGVRTTSDPTDPYTFKNLSSALRTDGGWDDPVVVAPTDYDGPAGIEVDGAPPIFIRSVAGSGALLLYHGIDPSQPAPDVYDGGHYATGQVLGRDASGTVWLAYRTPVSAEASGIYVRPFDAQSAQPLAASQAAPASASGSDLLEGHAAMACAARCRVVYPNADRTAVLSWAPGDPAPVTVAAARDPRQLRCAYDAAGRLWVAWHESQSPNPGFRVVHGDAAGIGTALTIADPTQNGTSADLGQTAVEPLSGGLLIVSNLAVGGDPRAMYASFVAG